MKYIVILLLCLLSLCAGRLHFFNNNNSSENHWAVLVAGSNGFWNYRHQSDIFHAYQLLLQNGVPKENIIVLAYDDIANNKENPIPGKIFNKPDPTGNGSNVYEGVDIDYKGADVTPQNFLAILEGDESKVKGKGTGRVLKSTENDNVFIYFSDHGATGLVAFPQGELYADQLITSLKKMHEKKSYKKLVFYLEACESGSMFNDILPDNLKIYATTAANPYQSSWATYCSPDDVIGMKSIGTCLGDEYSVNWMEDSDSNVKEIESLQAQYEHTRDRTINSEVHQYGTLEFTSENIWKFQGKTGDVRKPNILKKIEKYFKRVHDKVKGLLFFLDNEDEDEDSDDEEIEYLKEAKSSRVDSREAKLWYLYQKVLKNNDEETQTAFVDEVKHIKLSDSIFSSFNKELNINEDHIVNKINFDCLREAVESYKRICNHWGEYDLKYVKNIATACEMNVSNIRIEDVFRSLC